MPPCGGGFGRSAELGAGGGGRTHTRFEPHGILSPARLPIPPLRHVVPTVGNGRRDIIPEQHAQRLAEPRSCPAVGPVSLSFEAELVAEREPALPRHTAPAKLLE